jgi:hypothetical protein
MFILASKDAWNEYHAKRHEIALLRRYGADSAELSYLKRELDAWVRALLPAGRGGPWLIPSL